MASVDLFVFLDTVQFSKNSFQNRNRIRTSPGWQWLTVPVLAKGRTGELTAAVRANPRVNWQEKHWRSLSQNYRKARYFEVHRGFFEDAYLGNDWELLADVNTHFIGYIGGCLGIACETVRSSSLDVRGAGSDHLLNICLAVGANVYLSGPSGRSYLDLERFSQAGVAVRFHTYTHPDYSQCFDPFVPYMSAVDLLLNHGPHSARILDSGAGIELEV
jgi:hypothetical protein